MVEPRFAVRDGLSGPQAHELVLVLEALGVAASVEGEPGAHRVCVAERDAARAEEIAREEEQRPAERAAGPGAAAVAWVGPGAWAVALVVAVCVGVFSQAARRGGPSLEQLVDVGAISGPALARGELWRLATAVFVHFDGAHLAVNLAALLVLGPPLAALVGPAWFLVIFAASGTAGNALSYAAAPVAGFKAGASGGVAGVLGALAGVSLVWRPSGRFRRWQVLGALAAAYALVIGAGPGSDHLAHLGGLLSGVVLGAAAAAARRAPAATGARPRAGQRPGAGAAGGAAPLVERSQPD